MSDKARKKPIHLKEKITLYFDENFPVEIVSALKKQRSWKTRCKIYSAHDKGNLKRDDGFHFNYCKRKGYTLVTLDKGFMDDRRFPISRMPGIIRIVSGRGDVSKINALLRIVLDFLSSFPSPKSFIGESKFQVSSQGCIMKGKHASTREVKTVPISPGATVYTVGKQFGYFQ